MEATARSSEHERRTANEPERPLPTTTPHSLSKAVIARRSEYVRPKKIKIKIGTWNVAACPGTDKDLAGWFVEGKGIDKRLAGLRLATDIEENHSQDHVESVGDQENRRKKKEASIPRGDSGTIAGGDDIGLYVLGLQEVVELSSAKEYIGRVYSDAGPTTKWRKAVEEALPHGYQLVAEQQLSGLLIYIYASPDIYPTVTSVSTVSVGTGIMGYLGNKGAVTTRILLGETTRLVFVNSHLASGHDPTNLERRCWDVTQILQRTQFDPINWGGVLDDKHEGIGDEDFAFWFGDLNFRLDGLPGEDIRRLLMLHTRGEYDVGQSSRNKIDKELAEDESPVIIRRVDDTDDEEDNGNLQSRSQRSWESNYDLPDPDDFVQDPSQDPASLQATLDSLLPHDQLGQMQKKKKAFHDGWREGPVTFLPTYKYDVGSMGVFDSSEKKRAPSWCDRILFRTRKDKLEYEEKRKEADEAKKKDEEMKARGIDHAADDEEVLFDYNPEDDGEEPVTKAESSKIQTLPAEDFTTGKDFYDEYDEPEDFVEEVITKEGFVDKIHLNVYTSHQRILSSDHKPLAAVFTLEYMAVVPELKAAVQHEVARELDKAENEGRPGITIVVDKSQELDDVAQNDEPSEAALDSAAGVNFGPVSFQKRIHRSLTIANTSQVTSTISFVERPGDGGKPDQVAPSWLTVTFTGPESDEDGVQKDASREIKLEPGDVVSCLLELFVEDIAMIPSLNQHAVTLEDVLVLRVTDGRDHFIPVRASWLQSCFGRSMDELIRIPEGGVRALLPRRKGEPGGPINRGQEVRLSAPRELIKLTQALESLTEQVLANTDASDPSTQIPTAAGWPFDSKSWLLNDHQRREQLRIPVLEALDSGKGPLESFSPSTPAIEQIEIVAEVLLLWTSSLRDGIVNEVLWSQLDSAITLSHLADAKATKDCTLDILSTSPNHHISFVFLTSMMANVAGQLAPMPKAGWRESIRKEGVRRSLSLSWRGRPKEIDEGKVERRRTVEKAFAEAMVGSVFKAPETTLSAKEKRIMEERRSWVLECFMKVDTH